MEVGFKKFGKKVIVYFMIGISRIDSKDVRWGILQISIVRSHDVGVEFFI